jgi:hypothetical protein
VLDAHKRAILTRPWEMRDAATKTAAPITRAA